MLFDNIIENLSDDELFKIFKSNDSKKQFIEENKITEQSFTEWFSQVDKANFTFENYQQWMIDNGHVTTEFAKKMSKAGAVFKSFLGSLANIGATWLLGEAIGVVSTVITGIVQAEENLRRSAQELGSELSNTSSSIKNYKDKIQDLHDIINDSSSSIQEVAQARIDLMAIQDELIDKFGTEKNTIEDITYAINEQANALDNLARKAYYEAVNKFNKLNLGQQVNHFIKNLFGVDLGTNFDTMVGDMERSIYNLKSTGNKELDDLIAKSYGIRQFSASESDVYKFYLDGSLNELQDKLYGIQDLIQGWDVSSEFKNDLARISNDVDEALTSYQNLYDQYILYEKILNNDSNNQYDDQYKLINDAKKAYNDAVVSGNDSVIKNTSEKYAQTLQTAVDMAMQNGDSGVAEYFKSMYPELQEVVGQWRFNLNFEPNTDRLKDKLFAALDLVDGTDDGTRSFSAEQLNSFNTKIATDEQIEAYGTLINIADEYGLSISQLIALLEQMGIVQSETAKMASEGFLAELKDNFDAKMLTDLDMEGREQATDTHNSIVKWFKELDVDDQILAYELTVDYDTAEWGLEQFKTKLEEVKAAKEALNVTPISDLSEWLNVEANSEQLSNVKSNIDALSSAFEKLNSEDLTQSDLNGLLFDLLQQFPQLAEYTDGTIDTVDKLRLAIARLCNEQPDELINTLKELAEVEGISEDAKDQLLDFAETLENISTIDLSDIFDIEMDTTKELINDMQEATEQIAELKAAISDKDGYRLDFEEAREQLKVFPELLEGAKYCADGTVQLNENVTDEFIESRKSQVKADGQARISELEHAKALYESKKSYAEAELEVVKAGLTAKELVKTQEAIDTIESVQAKRDAFIQAGIDEVEANAEAAKAISGTTQELTNYLGRAVDTTVGNIDTGTDAQIEDIKQVVEAANKANEAIAKIGTGELVSLEVGRDFFDDFGTTSLGNGKILTPTQAQKALMEKTAQLLTTQWAKDKYGEDYVYEVLGGAVFGADTDKFNELLGKKTQDELIQEAKQRLEDMKTQLDTSIKGYNEAIASIDQQIAMINGEMTADFDSYVAGIINSQKGKEANEKINSQKGKEANEKIFDWIEVLIKNVERELQHLETTASSVYTNWAERNSALTSQMAKTREEIGLQQAAYLTYMQKAESVGLSSYWKNLAKNGALDISTITDENLAEQISTYQEYIDKANAAQDAVYELSETLSGLYQTSFENVVSQYDAILAVIETHQSIVEEKLSQAEEKGYVVTVEYYEALMKTERDNIAYLQKEKVALMESLRDAVNSGQIDEGSEAFRDMQDQINQVTLALEQANTAMIGYQNSIQDIAWEVFDLLQDRISKLTNEADFLIDLMDSKDTHDESGQLTDEGMATLGLRAMNYNVYMEQAKKYAEEMKNIEKDLVQDPLDQELIDRRYELLELQQEMIIAAEDEKDAILDLVNTGFEAELDALQEIIDKYKDALQGQHDLHEHRKDVSEQTETIVNLRKQIISQVGDNSEEGRANLQKLNIQLREAEEKLEETQYDKFIEDTNALLDEFYSEYELLLNERMDSTEVLLQDIIGNINDNSTSINETITTTAESVGYTLSNEMSNIWSSNTNNLSSVVTTYGDGIQSSVTKVVDVLNSINSAIQSMIEQTNAEAEIKVESATSSVSGTSNSGSSNSTTTTPSVTPPNTSASTSRSSNSSTPNNNGNFFIHKVDSYPKDKLNPESIVDRLKLRNIDSSFAARKTYYNAMGFGGVYVGSAKQNTSMVGWMKLHGYKSGVYNLPKNELAWTQEDGREVIVTRSGAMLTPLAEHDTVLNAEATRNMFEFFNDPAVFMRGLNLEKYSLDQTLVNKTPQATENTFNVEIVINNPNDFEDILYKLQHSKGAEKIIQAMTFGQATGKGKLSKYKY